MADGLRETPTHRSLYRPNLVAGGERELMLFSGALAAAVGITSQTLVAIVFSAAFWIVAAWGLRRMARADPMMSKVYMRQLRYRAYYAHRSRPWRDSQSKRLY